MAVGILGGAFDPPHNGHVELLAAAKAGFDIKRATVVVAAAPGHKEVATPAADRLALAKLAFPGDDVDFYAKDGFLVAEYMIDRPELEAEGIACWRARIEAKA